MRILDFIVTGQKIECDPLCDFTGIASGSKGYLYARFRFSHDWKGCRVVAVFSCRGHDCYAPLTNNRCEIPPDALTGHAVKVRLVGQCEKYRITTNAIAFEQAAGVLE